MHIKGTLSAIRDHFLILVSLLAADLAIKQLLHLQHLLDITTVARIDEVLSLFLLGIVVIFTVFGAAELILHGIRSVIDTASQLFPGSKVQPVSSGSANAADVRMQGGEPSGEPK